MKAFKWKLLQMEWRRRVKKKNTRLQMNIVCREVTALWRRAPVKLPLVWLQVLKTGTDVFNHRKGTALIEVLFEGSLIEKGRKTTSPSLRDPSSQRHVCASKWQLDKRFSFSHFYWCFFVFGQSENIFSSLLEWLKPLGSKGLPSISSFLEQCNRFKAG